MTLHASSSMYVGLITSKRIDIGISYTSICRSRLILPDFCKFYRHSFFYRLVHIQRDIIQQRQLTPDLRSLRMSHIYTRKFGLPAAAGIK